MKYPNDRVDGHVALSCNGKYWITKPKGCACYLPFYSYKYIIHALRVAYLKHKVKKL